MDDDKRQLATAEDAFKLVNDAMWTVKLQLRRVRSSEPEDAEFAFRVMADTQFRLVALRRLQRAAELLIKASPDPDRSARL